MHCAGVEVDVPGVDGVAVIVQGGDGHAGFDRLIRLDGERGVFVGESPPTRGQGDQVYLNRCRHFRKGQHDRGDGAVDRSGDPVVGAAAAGLGRVDLTEQIRDVAGRGRG